MKEFDETRLNAAITYIGRMADGNNPTNNRPANSELLDNPNVIRCLHFVKEVLEEVRNNNGRAGSYKKPSKKPFPFEVLKAFAYREDKSIMHLIRQFAEPVAEDDVRLPNAAAVNKWLGANGYLERRMAPQNGKEYWVPSEKGKQIGLYEREGNAPDGRFYITVMYNENAQRFMADHMEQIVRGHDAGYSAKKDDQAEKEMPGINHGLPEQDRQEAEDLYAEQWKQWDNEIPFQQH